jgi:hypothetical protein
MKRWMTLLAIAGAVTVPASAQAAKDPSAPAACSGVGALPCFPWEYAHQGFVQTSVSVPELGGGSYSGLLFVPANPSSTTHPAVALLHGLGGDDRNLGYLGRSLADHGFVAVAINVTASSGDDAAYRLGLRSMVAYLATRSDVDPSEIGVAGHSEGAHAASAVQDPAWGGAQAALIKTVVALDNLSIGTSGDAGSGLVKQPLCSLDPPPAAKLITPVRPALGLASDTNAIGCPDTPPDIKQFASEAWNAHGVPATELVLAGTNHFTFAQTSSSAAASEDLENISSLGVTWFEEHLMGSSAALCGPAGLLSTTHTSSQSLPVCP